MDYSLTTLFTLGSSNTLPTTGGGVASTANLSAGQFGVFNPDYTPATAAGVGAQPYVLLAQGRQQSYPGVGTKKSDKIYLSNVTEWYKITANQTLTPHQVTFSNFSNAVCGQDVTISLRLKSFLVDTGYYNGKTQSWTLTTPCCNCGSDPCATLQASDIQAIVDNFVILINNTYDATLNPNPIGNKNANDVASWVTASRGSSGATSTLIVTGKTLPAEPTTADPTVFSYQYDRLYFWGYAYKGPATSQDYNVWDTCDPFATVATTQTANYINGDYKQAQQLEKNFWSNNQAQIAKRIWSNVNFNQGFISEVTVNTFYDFYYIKYNRPGHMPWVVGGPQDETVIILNPTGQNATTLAVLTAFLGAPRDVTA